MIRFKVTEPEPVRMRVADAVAVGGDGTSDHRRLSNRDAEDQHPMSAITGLMRELDNKMEDEPALTNLEIAALLDGQL